MTSRAKASTGIMAKIERNDRAAPIAMTLFSRRRRTQNRHSSIWKKMNRVKRPNSSRGLDRACSSCCMSWRMFFMISIRSGGIVDPRPDHRNTPLNRADRSIAPRDTGRNRQQVLAG